AEIIGAALEPPARTMVFDLGRVERHYAAGGDAERIGVDALEIIKPEWDVHFGGIVFGAVELRPSHRLIEPAGLGRKRLGGTESRGRRGCRCSLQDFSSRHHGSLP